MDRLVDLYIEEGLLIIKGLSFEPHAAIAARIPEQIDSDRTT
jgi:hypothetical protein